MRRFVSADVFTARPFGGNPLPVVLDATGLSAERMQEVAREFDTSETTFVLPSADPAYDARVRIFTPQREIPFAGHPNVGTAFVLAREAAARGAPVPDRYLFEEGAGLVRVSLIRDGSGVVTGAEVEAPQPLSSGPGPEVAAVAAALSLAPEDLRWTARASVGLPFVVVELASAEALARLRPEPGAMGRLLPFEGAYGVYAFVRERADEVQARMVNARLVEDPATGSATCAAVALLAEREALPSLEISFRQGEAMGRPSLLRGFALRGGDGRLRGRVGGQCVAVMEGCLLVAEG
jgi:trans-2,3-dihydro-3-hydroxyanthranilate isomerase